MEKFPRYIRKISKFFVIKILIEANEIVTIIITLDLKYEKFIDANKNIGIIFGIDKIKK